MTDGTEVDDHLHKPASHRSKGNVNQEQWIACQRNKASQAKQLPSEVKPANNEITSSDSQLASKQEDIEDLKLQESRSIITRSVKRKLDKQTELKSDIDLSKQCSKATSSKSKKKKRLKVSIKAPDKERKYCDKEVDNKVETTYHSLDRALKGSVGDSLNKDIEYSPGTSYINVLSYLSSTASGKCETEKDPECDTDDKYQIRLPDNITNRKSKAAKGTSNTKVSEIVEKGRKASKGEYHCNECDFTFKYASAFNHHKKDGACVFICSYCGKRYTARYYFNYQLHLKYHNNEKQHLCSTCGKAFTEKSKLTIHLRSHSNERPYVCDTCGRAFYTNMLLRCHIKHMHRERPKSFSCDLCNSKFVSIYNLNTHKNVTHSDARPFQCKICQKSFKTKYALEKKHMSFHDQNGQLFYCNSCPKSFRKQEYLNLHMKRHKNERTHFCDKCGKGFYDMKTLKEHDRVHSGEKPYACTKCDYRCALKGNLSKHMKTHSDEQSDEEEITVSETMSVANSDSRCHGDSNFKEIGNPNLNQRLKLHPESCPILTVPSNGVSRSETEKSRTQNDSSKSLSSVLNSQNELARKQNEHFRSETEVLRSDDEFSNSARLLPQIMQYERSRTQNDPSRSQNDLFRSQTDISREQTELLRCENDALKSDNEYSNSLPMLPLLMRYDSFTQYQDSQGGSGLDSSAFSRLDPGLSQSDLNYMQYSNLFDPVINPFSFHLK